MEDDGPGLHEFDGQSDTDEPEYFFPPGSPDVALPTVSPGWPFKLSPKFEISSAVSETAGPALVAVGDCSLFDIESLGLDCTTLNTDSRMLSSSKPDTDAKEV